jgi:hypothetical protein
MLLVKVLFDPESAERSNQPAPNGQHIKTHRRKHDEKDAIEASGWMSC